MNEYHYFVTTSLQDLGKEKVSIKVVNNHPVNFKGNNIN